MKFGFEGDKIVWNVTKKREGKDESLGPEIEELDLSGEYVFGDEKSEQVEKKKNKKKGQKKSREKRQSNRAKKSSFKKAQFEIPVSKVFFLKKFKLSCYKKL